jgi:hypothetical protein
VTSLDILSNDEINDVKLRDQLLHCPDEALKKALDRALGDRVDLLEEIETLAVVRQSNHVNTLALMTAGQERDEPVRQFAARLHGLPINLPNNQHTGSYCMSHI